MLTLLTPIFHCFYQCRFQSYLAVRENIAFTRFPSTWIPFIRLCEDRWRFMTRFRMINKERSMTKLINDTFKSMAMFCEDRKRSMIKLYNDISKAILCEEKERSKARVWEDTGRSLAKLHIIIKLAISPSSQYWL